MGIYRVHTEAIRNSFYAPLFSFAVVFQLLIFALLVTLPYIIAYASEGMWIFERCYRQQADVKFKHEAYVVLQGSESFSQLAWSTSQEFNRIAQKRLRVPTVKSYEVDSNNDGRNDYLNFELEMPLRDAESIDHVTIALIFDYRLNYMADVVMESMAYVDYTGSGSGSELSVDGQLSLVQRDPLPWSGYRAHYNTPVFNSSSVQAEAYDFSNVVPAYLDRNETTVYSNMYSVWKSDRGAGQPFTMKMRVRYNAERICYRPAFWQEFKYGWVQYVAVLLPLLWIARYVQWFVFGNQIVESVVEPNAILRVKPHSH